MDLPAQYCGPVQQFTVCRPLAQQALSRPYATQKGAIAELTHVLSLCASSVLCELLLAPQEYMSILQQTIMFSTVLTMGDADAVATAVAKQAAERCAERNI